MASEAWLEDAVSALDRILRTEYDIEVDRAVLAHLVDRRRVNLARSLGMSPERAQTAISTGDIREVAGHIANRHSRAVA